jgi:hypothetical protein
MKARMLQIGKKVGLGLTTLATLSTITLMIGTNAWADRSVSISVPDGKLQLTNPSSGTVTYSVECYDKVTGSNIITGFSSVTLATKKMTTITSAGMCAAGQAPAKTLTQGPFFCSGNVTYSSAATLCGPNSHVCTIANLSSSGADPNQFLGYYWIKPQDAASTWYSTYDNWGKNNQSQDAVAGKKPNAPITYTKSMTQYRCSEGSAGTGAAIQGCSATGASNQYGTTCCPDNNGFASCKVTIHGTGVAAGHLQSPQFKGGAAF